MFNTDAGCDLKSRQDLVAQIIAILIDDKTYLRHQTDFRHATKTFQHHGEIRPTVPTVTSNYFSENRAAQCSPSSLKKTETILFKNSIRSSHSLRMRVILSL